MKVLIVGAGVIGSFNAARLYAGGVEVTLLARGQRFADLSKHGVVLEGAFSGRHSVTRVPLVERLDPSDVYDLAIVIVRRNQLPSVLPMLAQNHRIPTVLFLGNNAGGQHDMIEALGRQRVLIGMVNAGGERDGYVVRYIFTRWLPLLVGELDDTCTPRVEAIVNLFKGAGLPARVAKHIDARQKTHAAGLPGLAGALYLCGGDIRRLARTPEALRLFIHSDREVLHALRECGVPIRPRVARLNEWIPERMLMLGLRFFFDTNLAVVGGQRHANAAPDEMKELADEVREFLRQSGRPSPASDMLFARVDAQFAALAEPRGAQQHD